MRFTSDWVTGHEDRWLEVLGHLRGREAHMAEIGSYEGRSALWFLANVLTHEWSDLWCFDLWEQDAPDVERRFDSNLRGQTRVRKVKGDRWELAKLPPAYFDAIYIDGDHRSFAVLTDAVVAWRVLKVGGVLMFDDYGLGHPVPENGPAIGIDAFLAAAAGRWRALSQRYQVIVQKVSE